MTTKVDYSQEEWDLLLQAPVMAGTYIIVADPSITAMPKEMKGMLTAMLSTPAPADAQELVSSMVADIKARAENKEKMAQPEVAKDQNAQAQIFDQIGQALALLEAKAPQEKNGFSTWLMSVAQATAEAGKEGGFLGIGAVRVSDKEKTALGELSHFLGLN